MSIETSAARLRAACGDRVPRVAVLLGSGWGRLNDALQPRLELDYTELPAFPALGVAGHSGRLRVGTVGGTEVIVLSGRKHAYEGGDAAAMKGAIRTLAAAGVTTLLQTNAAGSLDPSILPGSLMLIEDHLNVAQRSPLLGETDNSRFVDLAEAYAVPLRGAAEAAAGAIDLTLHRGVYAWVLGPQFETPAEVRMLQRLGAQAVGMSTVPETILARHAGLQVLALSMITNMGCGLSDEKLSHAHTLSSAERAADDALRLMTALLPRLETLA